MMSDAFKLFFDCDDNVLMSLSHIESIVEDRSINSLKSIHCSPVR